MLTLNSISFRFGTAPPIFEDLSMQFEKGKTYGIVGANGVGKTTLFRSIADLYKLQKGQILIDHSPIHTTKVAFLPTNPYFYTHMKGIEYLKITQQNNIQLEQCLQFAKVLNIPLDNLVDTYSTGMQKKLAFISRYVQNKPVAIYDEPFNGVDLESNEVLLKLLLKDKEDKVTLVSSHILGMLFEFCDEIVHIEKGFVIHSFSPNNYGQLKRKIMNTALE